jgi:hypothetical protein
MRLWSFRGRRAVPDPPEEDLLVTEDVLRRSLEDVLAVRGRQIRGGVIVFRGDLLVELARALDVLLDARRFGYTPFLRAEATASSSRRGRSATPARRSESGLTCCCSR